MPGIASSGGRSAKNGAQKFAQVGSLRQRNQETKQGMRNCFGHLAKEGRGQTSLEI